MAIDTVAARVENVSAHLGHGLNTSMPRGEVDSIRRQWRATATVGTSDVPKDLLLRDEVLLDDSIQSPESLNDSSLDETEDWRGAGNRRS